MKKESIFKPKLLPWLTLIAGGIGFAARFILLQTQRGPDGLLPAYHPLSISLYLLTACTLAVLALCVLPLKMKPRHYRSLFRRSMLPAFGCMAAGIGILLGSLQQFMWQQDTLATVTMLMAFVATLCFGLLGFARQKGSHPHYMVHAGIIVYLMIQLLCLYRTWSSNPQLQLYFFQLMAMVFLMLTAYQAICLDIRKTNRHLYVFFNQAALFFCCLSLTDSLRYFYLGMGIFCATNLCSLRVSHAYYSDEDAAPETEEASENSEEAEDNASS